MVAMGATSLVASMAERLQDDEVQRSCLSALQSIISDAEDCKQAVSVGVTEAVVAALQAHETDLALQRQGCSMLVTIASFGESSAEMVSAAGGVVALVAAMRVHLDDVLLQQEGCKALLELSSSSEECRLAVKAANEKLPTSPPP